MNGIRQKITVVLSVLILLPAVLRATDAEQLMARVGQSILEGEGFRLFSFISDESNPLVLTATLDGQAATLLDIPASKEVVVAIKLGKDNLVEEIHIYFTGGSAIRRFGAGYRDLTFPTTSFSNPIQEGVPFLTLSSKDHRLEFQLSKK